jgi:4-hydroxy-3-polyprenylbenzoate decarboxylase
MMTGVKPLNQDKVQPAPAQEIVIGISGASGAILGIRMLEVLQEMPICTHLVISDSARITISHETDYSIEEVRQLADVVYAEGDLSARIASGSFNTVGMIVIPCSIKTLSAVANSYSADLMTRAADVTLKEGRTLVLVVRETPLHRGHIGLMSRVSQAGAVIFPPVPAFYTRPDGVDAIVNQFVGRVLARMGIENDLYRVWGADRQDLE